MVFLASVTAASNTCSGLFGCGTVTDAFGEPLGPGGDDVTGDLIVRAGFRHGDTVLDVGCGQGRATGLMAASGLCVTGIDPDADALRTAMRRVPNASFARAGGDALPIPDGAVDGVVAECVLSIMPDKSEALAEWVRVLRPGGRLAISDVYARQPKPVGDAPVRGGRVLSAEKLCGLITASGLSITHFEDRSALLRSWVGRFIFRYGSLDALWGDAGTAEDMRRYALGYCMAIAEKPAREKPTEQQEKKT